MKKLKTKIITALELKICKMQTEREKKKKRIFLLINKFLNIMF